ncbi:CynX/NimT family MFS transporter [Phenylobacterium aquaticum]|uniref:MFS transporter n=1 Tax=Phenylobacterium aquaticum TaxID=1763816 RepID=UPI001F5D5C8F|nr:MFS transporter [Phenylobacterium aquaticum]MCI3132388.1 MFS transporter [Phenylobacterium aquaticum]
MSKLEWRPWLLLGVFSLLLFLITGATFSSLGVVLPSMVADEKWSWAQAGLGFTLLGACCGGSAWFPPIVIRRFGVRAALLLGTGVMAAGFLCLYLTHSIWLYLLGTALCGVAYQLMALIPGTHVLAAVFKRRAMAFGLYFTLGGLGSVAGPWAAVAIMGATGGAWRPFWLAQIAAALVIGVLCSLLIPSPQWLAASSEQIDEEVKTEAETAAKSKTPVAVYRTTRDWTLKQAMGTVQFYILVAAYFVHLLSGVTVSSLSVAHLTQKGVGPALAAGMLSLEGLMSTFGRLGGGAIGDRFDPKWLLVFAVGALGIGSVALSIADTLPMMILYAAGTGIGFGLTALSVTVLLLNYFGRRHNLEIFSSVCLVGALSALGPWIGGSLRDLTGSFTPTFQLFGVVATVIFVAALFMRPPHLETQRPPTVRRQRDPLAVAPTLVNDPA